MPDDTPKVKAPIDYILEADPTDDKSIASATMRMIMFMEGLDPTSLEDVSKLTIAHYTTALRFLGWEFERFDTTMRGLGFEQVGMPWVRQTVEWPPSLYGLSNPPEH